jgi:SagB-type dehydrogenase family enzyme
VSERSADLARVRAYHELSKHHLQHYAPGPRGLEWANQPDPFLRYEGAPLVGLERRFPGDRVELADALDARVASAPFDARSVARLLFDSLALSAWKEFRGSRWALRVNPSSGNLHPTEAYLVLGPLPGIADAAGVHHYAPREHALELRATLEVERWRALSGSETGAFVVLTSILWREAWKYGERAFRYCQHDLGHALGALAYAAAGLGWEARTLEEPSTEALARFVGIEAPRGAESEEPECLVWIGPRGVPAPPTPPDELLARPASWLGAPRPLSLGPLGWREAELCTRATRKPRTPPASAGDAAEDVPPLAPPPLARPPLAPPPLAPPAGDLRTLVRGRRSAVALDRRTGLERAAFERMLDATLPRAGRAPFAAFPHRPRVALALTVHRVRDLEPGLWLFERAEGQAQRLRPRLRPEFLFEPAAGAGLRGLYLLLPADLTAVSATIACHQDIAADGAFSLGMIAELDAALEEHGPWGYRLLFRECGLVGQALYLAAEAAGVRGTGIGCFFDDAEHDLLGLSGVAWQDLYHFTVGGPVEDERLTTLPAYSSSGA